MKKIHHSGSTLVEVLLYVVIIGIMLSAMLPALWNVVEGGAKMSIHEGVTSTARNIMERIKYEIRNAHDISALSAGSLTLVNYAGANTTFSLNAGNIRINEGSGNVILNPDNTRVTQLVFTDYRSADGHTKNVMIQMTLTDDYVTTRQEYYKTIQLETSAELRGL